MSASWKPCSLGGWKKARRLNHGALELIAVGDVGPRILSLRAGKGPNLLWRDASRKLGRRDWRILGGHRLWIAPESELCYAADTGPCKAELDGDCLTLTAPPCPQTVLEKSFRIRPLEASGWIEVLHRVRNTGHLVYPAAPWALSCVEPVGTIYFPWGQGSPAWQLKQITYWHRWGEGQSTRINSPQWQPGEEWFSVSPTGEMGKVGAAPSEGWVAQVRPEATFLKAYRVEPGATYVDAGCSVEVFTCKRFVEMETLGPYGLLHPGETREHVERWCVLEEPTAPEALTSLARTAWSMK